MLYSKTLQQMVSEILKTQRIEFDKGLTDNCGASIDAIALVHKLASHKRYKGNGTASAITFEIDAFDMQNDILKYAKPLTKLTQNHAYFIVRKHLSA